MNVTCPMCGAQFNSPEELMTHVKSEHGIEIDPEFMNNLMKGLGSFFAEMFSGKSDMSSDTEEDKEVDPSLMFGNIMEQLMKTVTESIEGIQNIDADDTNQGMPNPFAMMMKNMFDQSIQTEPEPKDETPSPSTNEEDTKFKENSIEIPFSSDDEKKKDKKDSNE